MPRNSSPSSQSLSLTELLFDALRSPHGIIVREERGADALRMALYPIRKQHEELSVLGFVLSPDNPKELWIVKNEGRRD